MASSDLVNSFCARSRGRFQFRREADQDLFVVFRLPSSQGCRSCLRARRSDAPAWRLIFLVRQHSSDDSGDRGGFDNDGASGLRASTASRICWAGLDAHDFGGGGGLRLSGR